MIWEEVVILHSAAYLEAFFFSANDTRVRRKGTMGVWCLTHWHECIGLSTLARWDFAEKTFIFVTLGGSIMSGIGTGIQK